MSTFLQLIVYGLQLGSIYALLAVGYSMVFGIIRMINLAHGDYLMIGCYAMLFCANILWGNSVVGLAAVLLIIAVGATVAGLFGMGVERLAYKPLRKRPHISSMIAAIGVSLFTQNFLRMLPFVGPNPKTFPTIIQDKVLFVGDVQINSMRLITIGLTVFIMLVLYLIVKKTKYGINMRAVSCNKDAASLMGVNINQVISVTFFFGACLAALSGVFYASTYPVLTITMGSTLGNKAFISAVVGGIGDIRGAVLGGFIMGIVEIMVTAINSQVAYGVSFLVLVVILLVKPEGILGKPQIEKV